MTGKKIISAALIIGCLTLTGCVTYAPQPPLITGTPVQMTPPPPREQKKLVAIGGFENKSTYSADKLWETSAEFLMTALQNSSYFRVVEWARMKELLGWEELSTCSLFEKPGKKDELKKILLCEYFLMGYITRFDVASSWNTDALSKKKRFTTTVRVDLRLRDAATGEYVAGASGDGTANQTLSGGLGGGETGQWDPASANAALDRAIASALSQLILNYSRNFSPETRRPK